MRAAPLLAGCLLSAWLLSTAGDAPTLLIKVHLTLPACSPALQFTKIAQRLSHLSCAGRHSC